MKTIVVKWVPEDKYGYGKAMRVIESDHERYSVGTRFDYGFFDIATDEGYTIISLPMDNRGKHEAHKDGRNSGQNHRGS